VSYSFTSDTSTAWPASTLGCALPQKYQTYAQKRGDGSYLESHFSASYTLPRRSRLSLRGLPWAFSCVMLLQVMHGGGTSPQWSEKYQKKCQPKAEGLFNEDARSERILISESRSCWSNTSFNLACLGRQQDCPTPSARSYCSRAMETISLAEKPQTTQVTLQAYKVIAKVLIPVREESAPICRSAVAERPLSSTLLQKSAVTFIRRIFAGQSEQMN
jgi:hypothetical protein